MMQFSAEETATVLAALRYWQREGLTSSGHEIDIASNGDTLEPMTTDEIDELCERLNFQGGEKPEDRVEQLRQLKAAGLSQADCIGVFGVKRDEDAYARAAHGKLASDDLEFDETVLLSESGDGCWVGAWVYVSNADAGYPSNDEQWISHDT
jgi:hypothetical protein